MKERQQQSPQNKPDVHLLALMGLPIPSPSQERPLIGVIEGSGIGPEVIGGTLHVLAAVEQVTGLKFELRHGGLVGEEAEKQTGSPLPEATAKFYADIFARNGAILNGPGGGRFVYDLRERFDLFCKFSPVRPAAELVRDIRISVGDLSRLDMLIVRDNAAGVYQGKWKMRETPGGKVAEHSFSYTETQVRRLAEIAARAAVARRGKMHVVVKDSGVPSITALWRDVSVAAAKKIGAEVAFINVDLAAYEFIRNPLQFDVVLTPNLFGDILVDLTGALLGSRGVTFSGNYDAAGHGVYQTNHGCAHDLAHSDVANPAGQIMSLAMMLRESFGLVQAAALVESALRETWRQGWRTADIAEPGFGVVGTLAMADHIAQQVLRLAEKPTAAE